MAHFFAKEDSAQYETLSLMMMNKKQNFLSVHVFLRSWWGGKILPLMSKVDSEVTTIIRMLKRLCTIKESKENQL